MSEENLTAHWGVNGADDDQGSRKSLACKWIEVMRGNPGLADKIRNNQLLESDLFVSLPQPFVTSPGSGYRGHSGSSQFSQRPN